MGGEYLPAYGKGEAEIARIELASVTSDAISVRATKKGRKNWLFCMRNVLNLIPYIE